MSRQSGVVGAWRQVRLQGRPHSSRAAQRMRGRLPACAMPCLAGRSLCLRAGQLRKAVCLVVKAPHALAGWCSTGGGARSRGSALPAGERAGHAFH